MLERGMHHEPHALERGNVAGFKNVGFVREKLEDADNLVVAQQWHHDHRPYPKSFATFAIDALVGVGVVAAQGLAGAHALSGKAGVDLQLRTYFRCGGSSACTAYISPPSRHARGRPGAAVNL